ncbi:MAG: amidoligase family protein [Kiritimatiellia bacterium]
MSRDTAAKVVAEVTGGTARYEGRHLSNWVVTMPDGRRWQVVSDGSLCGGAEVVTPILKWEDIETLQKVVRALRAKGAKANERTGLHVHVGAADFTPTAIKNLVRTFYKQETLILKAAGTKANRIARYTRTTDHAFVDKICKMANPTMEKINTAWFGRYNPHPYHYDEHRYRALNLNNLWDSKKTVEYRFFNGTTHAGEVKTAVQLSLLIAIRAKAAKASSAKNPRPYSETSAKYDLRVFLLRLGANGPIFKTMRKHLTKNLPGSAAWKNGRRD